MSNQKTTISTTEAENMEEIQSEIYCHCKECGADHDFSHDAIMSDGEYDGGYPCGEDGCDCTTLTVYAQYVRIDGTLREVVN